MRKTVEKDTWHITYNEDKSVIHHGKAEAGMTIHAGQPEFETFDNEADYLKRLNELGVEPETEE